jgi:hypothetical protein
MDGEDTSDIDKETDLTISDVEDNVQLGDTLQRLRHLRHREGVTTDEDSAEEYGKRGLTLWQVCYTSSTWIYTHRGVV